jgi:hypothetical protein
MLKPCPQHMEEQMARSVTDVEQVYSCYNHDLNAGVNILPDSPSSQAH